MSKLVLPDHPAGYRLHQSVLTTFDLDMQKLEMLLKKTEDPKRFLIFRGDGDLVDHGQAGEGGLEDPLEHGAREPSAQLNVQETSPQLNAQGPSPEKDSFRDMLRRQVVECFLPDDSNDKVPQGYMHGKVWLFEYAPSDGTSGEYLYSLLIRSANIFPYENLENTVVYTGAACPSERADSHADTRNPACPPECADSHADARSPDVLPADITAPTASADRIAPTISANRTGDSDLPNSDSLRIWLRDLLPFITEQVPDHEEKRRQLTALIDRLALVRFDPCCLELGRLTLTGTNLYSDHHLIGLRHALAAGSDISSEPQIAAEVRNAANPDAPAGAAGSDTPLAQHDHPYDPKVFSRAPMESTGPDVPPAQHDHPHDPEAFFRAPVDDLILISPFISSSVLFDIMQHVAEHCRCIVVTNPLTIRYLIEKLPADVICRIAFLMAPADENGDRPYIHAKLFLRRHGNCWDLMCGSMNLTAYSMRQNAEFVTRLNDLTLSSGDPAAFGHEPGIFSSPSATPHLTPAASSHAPATPFHAPAESSCAVASSSHAPTTPSHVPATSSHAPATPSHAPTTPSHAPAAFLAAFLGTDEASIASEIEAQLKVVEPPESPYHSGTSIDADTSTLDVSTKASTYGVSTNTSGTNASELFRDGCPRFRQSMSPVLRKAISKETRIRFLQHQFERDRFLPHEIPAAISYLLSCRCADDLTAMSRGDRMPAIPERHEVTANGRLREVYRLPLQDKILLGLLNHALHMYDDRFSEHLFSHRQGVSTLGALSRIREHPAFSSLHLFRTDISAYGSSMDPAVLSRCIDGFFPEDPTLRTLLQRLASRRQYLEDGQVRTSAAAVQDGLPLCGFFENLYLWDFDHLMDQNADLYVRYGDDILIGARNREKLDALVRETRTIMDERKLSLSERKTSTLPPGETFTYLGWKVCGNTYDLSEDYLEEMRQSIRQQTRWMQIRCRKAGIAPEFRTMLAVRQAHRITENMNLKRIFQVVTTADGLRQVDRMLCDMIRAVASGKNTEARFRIRYRDIRRWGYRSLVGQYYRWINRSEGQRPNPAGANDE